jgi:RNA-directed DNA polymerase
MDCWNKSYRPSNLNAAYLQVKRNKGKGGVDKMEVESLKDYLVANKEKLYQHPYCGGKYRPNPVRRVETQGTQGQWAKREL